MQLKLSLGAIDLDLQAAKAKPVPAAELMPEFTLVAS